VPRCLPSAHLHVGLTTGLCRMLTCLAASCATCIIYSCFLSPSSNFADGMSFFGKCTALEAGMLAGISWIKPSVSKKQIAHVFKEVTITKGENSLRAAAGPAVPAVPREAAKACPVVRQAFIVQQLPSRTGQALAAPTQSPPFTTVAVGMPWAWQPRPVKCPDLTAKILAKIAPWPSQALSA
jgi:hypothetical protein